MVKPIKRLQIGKNGLSLEFIEQVKRIFENERVVKITILKSACRNKKDAEKIGDDLVEALGEKYDYKLVGYVLTVVKYRKVQR
jgi:RNA-binding protein YhbY